MVELDGQTLAILAFPLRRAAGPPVALTEIERVLLRAVVRGLSNFEIAEGRGRSVHSYAPARIAKPVCVDRDHKHNCIC